MISPSYSTVCFCFDMVHCGIAKTSSLPPKKPRCTLGPRERVQFAVLENGGAASWVPPGDRSKP